MWRVWVWLSWRWRVCLPLRGAAPTTPWGAAPTTPWGAAPTTPWDAVPTTPWGAAPTTPWGAAPTPSCHPSGSELCHLLIVNGLRSHNFSLTLFCFVPSMWVYSKGIHPWKHFDWFWRLWQLLKCFPFLYNDTKKLYYHFVNILIRKKDKSSFTYVSWTDTLDYLFLNYRRWLPDFDNCNLPTIF